MAYLAGISIYPVKSLEPLSLQQVRILPSGALEGDRTFALFDDAGAFINGKRNPLIHQLRSSFDLQKQVLRLSHDGAKTSSFQVGRDRVALEGWLSAFFSKPVTFKRNDEVGFPDDLDCPGPTIISTSTLGEVASWFPPLDAAQLRLRIRANLEIAGVPPFWEDRMYAARGSLVRFRIGDCLFDGNNPCQRCVVPPRDPQTGQNYPDFTKIFMDRRKQTLPPWANASRFNHYYRLAINTIVPASERGKVLKLGDEVVMLCENVEIAAATVAR